MEDMFKICSTIVGHMEYYTYLNRQDETVVTWDVIKHCQLCTGTTGVCTAVSAHV